MKDDSAKAASLAANIQKLADEHPKLRTFVVFVGGQEVEPTIRKIADEKKVNIPLTFLPGGANAGDFQQFKINPQAKNTVLVYNKKKVVANFVNVDDQSFAEVSKAVGSVAK